MLQPLEVGHVDDVKLAYLTVEALLPLIFVAYLTAKPLLVGIFMATKCHKEKGLSLGQSDHPTSCARIFQAASRPRI